MSQLKQKRNVPVAREEKKQSNQLPLVLPEGYIDKGNGIIIDSDGFSINSQRMFEKALLRGTGVEKGVTRIYEFFMQKSFNKNAKETFDFLKKEYGTGGCGIPIQLGLYGIYYDSKEFVYKWIDQYGEKHKESKTWKDVAMHIELLIIQNCYKPETKKRKGN